ncbi:bactofilin family protein [Mucilaginibacter ginsenosidivorans]|uniref:Polymer-forming cytoskeletal protein n=1 Tax=Mucilaginibacter ginsenosidivorans TaxID=398053 RepID=A0A5B8UUP8_9SPHI|nr:polymer-forming cytoskeletal protein [Mucilaginibacter ginsenosidivorans]QEC62663.1 polymer-forming cytoskeletal protein [Mucilaginibacter ginsenosidivorans]
MFSKKKKVELDQQAISTLISEGCVFDGNMKAPAYVRIDGTINGDVTIDEGLILGEKGSVTGNIHTKDIIVYGTVNGNINTHSLEIRSTGRITGDIKTQVLQVETGGAHNGKLSMSANTQQVAKHTKPELVSA